LPDARYFTTTEVAVLLQVTTETVVNMCKRGELRHIKIAAGRQYRIPQTALDEYVKGTKQASRRRTA
jgi:excisionase family DNA binding protein